MTNSSFIEKYGPWALIAGASEGVGAEFARTVAGFGVNVVLIARRASVLEGIAEQIRSAYGVEVRVLAVDLAQADAMDRIFSAVDDIQIGLFLYCAGADPNYRPFLSTPIADSVAMVQRNCVAPMQMSHHFAAGMVERRSGGIILVSSGAGFTGAANVAVYGGTKAFDMVFGEGLWAEMQDFGVDVLSLVLGATDTPALRRILASRGVISDASGDQPIEGISTTADVVADILEYLSDGPTRIVGERLRQRQQELGALSRSDAVRATAEAKKKSIMEPGRK